MDGPEIERSSYYAQKVWIWGEAGRSTELLWITTMGPSLRWNDVI
jgi:hypothetical protein